jgi:hypothetical protein
MLRTVLFATLVLATVAGAQTNAVSSPPPAAEQLAPAPAPAPTPGEIVIPQYAPGVAPPTEGPVKLDPAANAQWRKEKLSFAAGTSVVVQGPNAEPVDRVTFYKLVGRPDLAAEQEDRQRREIWFISGGVLLTAASLIGGIALANSNDAPVSFTDPVFCTSVSPRPGTASNGCTISSNSWQTATGTVIAVVGGVGGLVLVGLGLAANVPVTTVPEDQTLVGEYNDLLLQRLAGTKKSFAPPFSPVPRVDFQVGSGGGMLKAFWTF